MDLALLRDLDQVTAEDITDAERSLGKVTDKEKVVGEVPEDLRRLFALGKMAHKKAEEVAFDSLGEIEKIQRQHRPGEELPQYVERQVKSIAFRASAQANKGRLINRLFWYELRQEIPEANKYDDVKIKEGWKIIGENKPAGQIQVIAVELSGGGCPDPECPIHREGGVLDQLRGVAEMPDPIGTC